MEIQKQASPEWLEAWLQLPFYEEHERCKKHEKKYNTVFCGVCKEHPVCDICWKVKSKEHQFGHHQILHVRAASHRAGITVEEISKLLDISDIQRYSINSQDIVFLNPHEEGARNPNYEHKCEKCKRRLMEGKYRFCSIACKNKSVERIMQIEKKSDPKKEKPTLKRKKSTECSTLRKRSRKGIPQRAPLK